MELLSAEIYIIRTKTIGIWTINKWEMNNGEEPFLGASDIWNPLLSEYFR